MTLNRDKILWQTNYAAIYSSFNLPTYLCNTHTRDTPTREADARLWISFRPTRCFYWFVFCLPDEAEWCKCVFSTGTELAPEDRGNSWLSRPESTDQTNCSLILVIYLLEEHFALLIFSTLNFSDLLHHQWAALSFLNILDGLFHALIGSSA